MQDLIKEGIRWLFGGGALALATFLGTTAYQQGQLEIEREARLAQIQIDRERYLRDFLDKYVELATKGTLDERIRFVLYWKYLNVGEQIGVDLGDYEQALIAEFNEAETFASVLMAGAKAGESPLALPPPPATASPPPVAAEQPQSPPSAGSKQPPQQQAAVLQQAPVQQEAFFASRSQTIAKLVPGAADAPTLERQGFEALLNNDIRAAYEAFRAAEKAWPEYHNVAEIARVLGKILEPGQPGADGILGPASLKALYEEVLRDYSWGMPPALKARMQTAARS